MTPTVDEKPKFSGTVGDDQSFVRICHAAADDRIDIYLEFCVVAQVDELGIEHLEALFRNVVGRDVVDRYLQIIEARFVKLFDLFGLEVIAVRDQSGDHPVMADAGDDLVDLRVHHRLAARDRDDGRTKFRQLIDPLEHHVDRHRVARFVVFVAVRARQITPPHRHNVDQNRMLSRSKSTNRVPHPACKSAKTACLWHKRKTAVAFKRNNYSFWVKAIQINEKALAV